MTIGFLIICYWTLVSWIAGLLMYEDLRNGRTSEDTILYILTRPIMWVVTPFMYTFDNVFKTRRRFRY